MKKLNNKINVLFVMMYLNRGGSEGLVHNLALKLDRNLFNPSIAYFFEDGVFKEFSKDGVPLYHVPKIERFDISTMQGVGEIIRKNNIHIVNAHHFMPMVYSFYGCKIKNNCRLIYTEHAKSEVEKVPWRWKKIGSYLLNRSDAAVGVTGEVSEAIHDKFKLHSSKVFTIKNGVDLSAYRGSNNRKVLRKKLGIEEDDKVIGIVANLKRIKNHIFLLKAFDELVKSYKKVKLLLIGQGFENDTENTEAELQGFVNEKGLGKKVLLLGYRPDIPSLLNIMDIFCLTSFNEGLPISLIEAMAAGLPVVGTDVEGIRDTIIHDKNGFLVKTDDIHELRNVLYMLLKDEPLRQRFSKESQFLSKEYSLEQCGSEYENLFLSVLINNK
jgi:glycosyltransferase involved in cell wall biosynthesis